MQETLTSLYASLKDHLRAQYAGILDESGVERHIRDYAELEMSESIFAEMQTTLGETPARLMDLGCGFGSFVLVCRKHGVEAYGVDVAEFDLDFARQRMAAFMPGLNPQNVYALQSAESTPFPAASFDVVTAWNLLEHVPDFRRVVREAYRLLKPGGFFMGIAPNYAAFRREAHYFLPWLPLLPRKLASLYLRLLGRSPEFFEKHIYYVTNWGVLNGLKKAGFALQYPDLLKAERPETIKSPAVKKLVQVLGALRLKPLLQAALFLSYWNPFKSFVFFMARKPK